MFPIDECFEWVLENAFFSNYRALVNIFSIHALILVVNILVRKRPLLGYALAALFMLIVSSVVTSFVEIEYRDAAMMCIYIAIIVTSWVGCYFLLRKFQYKS
jgi:Na+-translocating ferredoxin:NAD+ oxidoreductase RnfE subunit